MWLGWLRLTRRERWELVADGPTLDLAAARLHAAAGRRGVTDNRCWCLTTGAPPPHNRHVPTRPHHPPDAD
jgi:hypothetical protein